LDSTSGQSLLLSGNALNNHLCLCEVICPSIMWGPHAMNGQDHLTLHGELYKSFLKDSFLGKLPYVLDYRLYVGTSK
jgi:hypothetical protein